MLRRTAGIVLALAVLTAPYLLTAVFPQWPLWLCLILGVAFLVAIVVAQLRPQVDRPDYDDSEA
ncbi:hypothetical protein O7635_07760 [Asanoa sp. WMMD1127]|uniref:hypothetical protein n=1 Tax=Asanoa sp. WMMD1127 TaxID=3016107 RepID=UPI0024174498|nr:hypothetical protein [Asanoa sp. WMMD1127]MDG4821748.1 hypothetical protein [Asanoa sp. WMMD1127]